MQHIVICLGAGREPHQVGRYDYLNDYGLCGNCQAVAKSTVLARLEAARAAVLNPPIMWAVHAVDVDAYGDVVDVWHDLTADRDEAVEQGWRELLHKPYMWRLASRSVKVTEFHRA